MAIEVTRVGTVPGDKSCKGTCTNCHSEMRWRAKDGTHIADQREGDYNVIRCPICGHKVCGSYA